MRGTFLANADVSYLDEVLLDRAAGVPKPVPAKQLEVVPLPHLQLWCVKHAVYQIVTEELVAWLAVRCRGRRAVEICAGYGTIGRALGIPATDSYMQTRPDIRAYYAALGQPVIEPPADVVRMDGNAAVRHYKAEVVIGAFVTQLYRDGDAEGSVLGVDEVDVLYSGARYIHVGNDVTHANKRILRVPHDHHSFPWLFSRAQNPDQNHVCVWPPEQEAP